MDDSSYWKTVGDGLRVARGWMPRQEAARQLGVNRLTLKAIEDGRGGQCRADILMRYAALVGYTLPGKEEA